MRLFFSLVVGLLLIGTVATAETKTEYRFETGACEGSDKGWWSVTTYTNGVPTHVSGKSCTGETYDYDLPPKRIVSGDPTGGHPPTFTGTCGSGTWFAVVNRNAAGYVTWMGGLACDGQYWVIDDFQAPGPGGGSGGLE